MILLNATSNVDWLKGIEYFAAWFVGLSACGLLLAAAIFFMLFVSKKFIDFDNWLDYNNKIKQIDRERELKEYRNNQL